MSSNLWGGFCGVETDELGPAERDSCHQRRPPFGRPLRSVHHEDLSRPQSWLPAYLSFSLCFQHVLVPAVIPNSERQCRQIFAATLSTECGQFRQTLQASTSWYYFIFSSLASGCILRIITIRKSEQGRKKFRSTSSAAEGKGKPRDRKLPKERERR